MTLEEGYRFTQWLDEQGKWSEGWRVLRIERTIGYGMREGYEWAVLLSKPSTGEVSRVSDPLELGNFPHRLQIIPGPKRETWPGSY